MDYQIAAWVLALSVLLLQTTANDEQNGKAYLDYFAFCVESLADLVPKTGFQSFRFSGNSLRIWLQLLVSFYSKTLNTISI